MLPDLRLVLAAVVSTFICTVAVGFYASSRLQHEPFRTDARGGTDDSPITRIVLSWPEPMPVERNLNLDFAVTHRAAKSPVRDVTHGIEAQSDGPVPQRMPDTPEATKAATETQVAPSRSEKATIAPSLVDDDTPTGSIGDPSPITPIRPGSIRNANLPDSAAEDGATNARGEAPATRIRIVKKPATKRVVAKARIKKKPRIVVTANPPAQPVTAAQLEFPFFTFFSRPSTLN